MTQRVEGIICDVDGVLVESPHEQAWREALEVLVATDWRDLAANTTYRPDSFTAAFYQRLVAGKPRLDGARAALEAFGFPNAATNASVYAAHKQHRLVQLIELGRFRAFADAADFVRELRRRGLKLAAASSSRNATGLLKRAGLLDVFQVDVCGRAVPRGKPHPDLFLLAARELGLAPVRCVVVEDAPAGVLAARAAGMRVIGVARLQDEALLESAGADLVVASLNDVAMDALRDGRLERLRRPVVTRQVEECDLAAVAARAPAGEPA